MKDMVYPLLALRGIIVFPNMVTPLEVGRELSIHALEAAMTADKRLVLLPRKMPVLSNRSKKTSLLLVPCVK